MTQQWNVLQKLRLVLMENVHSFKVSETDQLGVWSRVGLPYFWPEC